MHKSAQPTSRPLPSRGQRAMALLVILAVVAGLIGSRAFAADSGKTITLGESLSDAERQELLSYFEAGPGDRVETVTVDETKKAMEGITDRPIASAYSSTALTCRTLGDGLEVRTRNINLITPSLYAIALVTAGIGDGQLLVAAPDGAPAQGMTALTGVFKTWDIAPCDSGNTSKKRQRLALEQIAIAVDISEVLQVADPIKVAGDLVLYTQQEIVVNGLRSEQEISDEIGQQEAIQGIAIPDPVRQRLVDFMVKLAKEKIDWSTFAAGWTITPTDDGTGIAMMGDGIAIRSAQMTATVRAAENMTATAEAQIARDATKAAESAALTATAEAENSASADATQAALSAAMTATAAAEPTQAPTATPEPTPTPEPVAVSGQVTDIRGGQVWIQPTGLEETVAYTVPADAAITRGGDQTALSSVKPGDHVNLTVDTYSQTVRELHATAPSSPGIGSKLAKFLFLIPALAVIPLILFLRGRGGVGDPFVVKRVASA